MSTTNTKRWKWSNIAMGKSKYQEEKIKQIHQRRKSQTDTSSYLQRIYIKVI